MNNQFSLGCMLTGEGILNYVHLVKRGQSYIIFSNNFIPGSKSDDHWLYYIFRCQPHVSQYGTNFHSLYS